MIDVGFVFIFFLYPFLIFLLMKWSGMSLIRLEIPSFVILSMFAFAYVGLFPLYFGWDEYRYASGVQDKVLVFQVFCYSSFSILAIIIGYIIAKSVFRSVSIPISCEVRPLKRIELFYFFLLLIFVCVVLVLYISKLPRVAIVVALSDGISEAKVARSMMGNDFSGKYHWYSVIMYDLANVISFTLFAAWLALKKKKKKILFFFFFSAFSVSSFSALMTTEKAPFAWFLIGLFFTYILVRHSGNIPVKKTIIFSLVILAFLMLFYILFMGSSDIGVALFSVFSRAFTGSIQPAYHYLEFFPEHQDFLLGRSFPNPGGLLPFEPYKLTVEVMNWRFPNLAEKGIVGSMPTVFWAEIYANFGVFGVLIMPISVGFFIYTISFFSNKLENTPIRIGFIVWLLLHYKKLSVTGLSGFIIDFYLVVILFFILSVLALSNKLKIKLCITRVA